MADDVVTTFELGRRIDSLERRVDAGFADVKRSVDSLQFVHRDSYRIEMDGVSTDVAAIQERMRWLVRALFVSLILPIVTGIVVGAILFVVLGR